MSRLIEYPRKPSDWIFWRRLLWASNIVGQGVISWSKFNIHGISRKFVPKAYYILSNKARYVNTSSLLEKHKNIFDTESVKQIVG